jgi:hypothetical protein
MIVLNSVSLCPGLLVTSTMSSNKHWSWEYYFSDGNMFLNNNSNKNAWCKACLDREVTLLRESDIVGAVISGMDQGRTDEQREQQGMHFFNKYWTC